MGVCTHHTGVAAMGLYPIYRTFEDAVERILVRYERIGPKYMSHLSYVDGSCLIYRLLDMCIRKDSLKVQANGSKINESCLMCGWVMMHSLCNRDAVKRIIVRCKRRNRR